MFARNLEKPWVMVLFALAGWSASHLAGGEEVDGVNIVSEVAQFDADPEKVRTEQRPRLVVSTGERQASLDRAPATAYSATKTENRFVFRLAGHVPEVRAMCWESAFPQRDLRAAPYYILRYRAQGQRRGQSPSSVISLRGTDVQEQPTSATLLDCSEVINEGSWHVIIGQQRSIAVAKSIEVWLGTQDSAAMLELAECSVQATIPHPPSAFPHVPFDNSPTPATRLLDLSRLFNDEYTAALERTIAAHEKIVDGGSWLAADRILAGSVPFVVRRDGKNIIAPPSTPTANTGTVNVLGTTLEKRLYKPIARDDTIVVPANGRASEICFLLVAEMPPTVGRYSLPRIPLQLHNLDAFCVQVAYVSGDSDWAFPYSVADGGFAVQRAMGVYAVPADPSRELRSIIFHNRVERMTFSVAAVTLHARPDRIIPASALAPPPQHVTQLPPPPHVNVRITAANGVFDIRNTHYEIQLDCQHGFGITRLVHRWSPNTSMSLDATSGLELQLGDRVWTGRDLQTDGAVCNGNSIAVDLKSADPALPLRMRLTITADDSPQLRLNALITGTGELPPPIEIRFPVLKQLTIGNAAETWLYFPQCRNVCTQEAGTYLAPNDRPFPLQFFDVFHPQAGVGLAFLTHNTSQDVLDYSVRKTNGGIEACIQYPAAYHRLAPDKPHALTETCLVFHEGDWHRAFTAYQEWLARWYKPANSGDLDGWYRSFLLRAHLTAKAYSWTVPIYDAAAHRYRIDELLNEDKVYLGQTPDIVHLGGWVDFQNLQGGDFHGGDYAVEDYTGGADTLRAAVAKLQAKDVRVSVYTIPDRCAKNSRIGTRCGPKIAQVNADGKLQEDEKCWYVCLGAQPWQDHYIEALKRTQQETGVNAIYVDVFGYTRRYACYSQEHGHEVPLNVNQTCHDVISKLRAQLPEGVAIWSEFPLTDVNSQFTNGNITYYFLTLHEFLVASYDQIGRAPAFLPVAQSLQRFAFPSVKQFGFPVGFEGSLSSYDLRALFFNGEGLYDVGFLLYDSRELARIRKWLAIQREYADCFASTAPTPLVETAAGAVFANEFPGEQRTAWTLFNGRFTTYRGPVLELEHRDGDVYFDVWNRQPLLPRIENNQAVLELALDPQEVGCVVRTRR